MGSFNIIVRASMNIFINFGNVQVLQINAFWKLSHLTKSKPYEQRWPKTFYFGAQIFLEILPALGRLYEFFPNL